MVETAFYDPVVVEPSLTPLKVRELISLARESAKLDYKLTIDVSDTSQKVEMAKDVMAMANTAGGYIVIGVDNSGAVMGCERNAAARMDESVIRSQVAGYTTARIPIFVDNRVVHEARQLVVITVLPVAGTLVIAEADGNSANRPPAFRSGDVLVRHGSSSERWNQADAEFLLRRIISTRKEEWLGEFGRDIRSVLSTFGAQQPTPVGVEAYDLPAGDFQELVTDLLRRPNG
jgi:hypothetical protein